MYSKQTQRQQTELSINTGKVHLLNLVVSIYYGQGCLRRVFSIEALLLQISRKYVIILIYAFYRFLGELSVIMGILGKISLFLKKSVSEMGKPHISILSLIFDIFVVVELQSKKPVSDNPGHK